MHERGAEFGRNGSNARADELAWTPRGAVVRAPGEHRGIVTIHLDIGGEGRYANAINVNPNRFVTEDPARAIPNLVLGRGEQLPFANGIADLITVESAPLRPGAAAWGVPLRAWAVGYPAYLVGMTVPGASHPRYWLLSLVWLWPFPDALRTDSSTLRVLRRVLLGVVVVGGLAAQVWWIRDFWIPHRFTP